MIELDPLDEIDSLDRAEVSMALEQAFELRIPENDGQKNALGSPSELN